MTKRPIVGEEAQKHASFVENDGPLFNAARWYGFLYGCVGTGFYLVLYIIALRGAFYRLTDSQTALVTLFCFHALAGVLTFQRQLLQKWKPLFAITPARVRFAQWTLSITSIQFTTIFLLFGLCGNERQALRIWLVPVILTSFLLQNTIYIAFHWALRPENFLPPQLIEALTNPLGFVASLFR